MKDLLKTFIQRHGGHCMLMLCTMEPLYKKHIENHGALVYVIGAVFLLFLLYPLVIQPIIIALHPHREYHKDTKESVLLTIFICVLGIWGQYLSSPDGHTFNSITAFFLVLIVAGICDLIAEFINKGKKKK